MDSRFPDRCLRHVRRNLIAYLALFVALGGTGYAASQLPKNSVGTKQLKNGAVTKPKLATSLFGQLKGKNGLNGKNGTNGTNGGGTVVTFDHDDSVTGALPLTISGVAVPTTTPTTTIFTKSVTIPSGDALIVNGTMTIDLHCPAASPMDCVIAHGGVYVGSTGIPGTDPNYALDIAAGGDTIVIIAVSGALHNTPSGSQTVKIGITQTQGTPLVAGTDTHYNLHGYAITMPEGS